MKTKRFVSEGPKKPQSAFFLFASDARKTLPKMSVSDTGKKLGEMWREMDSAEKQKYVDLYNTKHEEYTKELEAFKKTDTYAKEQELKKQQSKLKKSKKTKEKKSEGKKKLNGFDVYYESLLAAAIDEKKTVKKSELRRDAKVQWDTLTDEAKAKFNLAAQKYNKKSSDKDSSEDSLAEDDDSD